MQNSILGPENELMINIKLFIVRHRIETHKSNTDKSAKFNKIRNYN